jgi:large subunit ribosomal protein L44e
MKKPKKIKRYCPYCKKHTEQKVVLISSGHKRGTLRWGSITRAKLRGKGRGFGNLGKWGSKKAVTKFKRTTKTTKKTNIMYTCQVCKKSKYQKKGLRTSKIQVE